MPPAVQAPFAVVIGRLAKDWPRVRMDARPLVGREGAWRVRVGAYRGVFQAEPDGLVFTRFGHRGHVYR